MRLITYIGEGRDKRIQIWGKEYYFEKGVKNEMEDAISNKIISNHGAIFISEPLEIVKELLPPIKEEAPIIPVKATKKAKKNDKKTTIL